MSGELSIRSTRQEVEEEEKAMVVRAIMMQASACKQWQPLARTQHSKVTEFAIDAGMGGLQRYNSLPVPRPNRVSIDGRRRPLPDLDQLLPSSSKELSSSAAQRWNRIRSQMK